MQLLHVRAPVCYVQHVITLLLVVVDVCVALRHSCGPRPPPPPGAGARATGVVEGGVTSVSTSVPIAGVDNEH